MHRRTYSKESVISNKKNISIQTSNTKRYSIENSRVMDQQNET